jgi:hypothetical protein
MQLPHNAVDVIPVDFAGAAGLFKSVGEKLFPFYRECDGRIGAGSGALS